MVRPRQTVGDGLPGNDDAMTAVDKSDSQSSSPVIELLLGRQNRTVRPRPREAGRPNCEVCDG